jgi:hypothetical protein
MKGWKKRAYEALRYVARNVYFKEPTIPELIAEYDSRRAEKRKAREAETPKPDEPAPLSDDYLALWVPRMEETAESTSLCHHFGICSECPVRGKKGCPPSRPAALAWLLRPDVVAWKERQKWTPEKGPWPVWIATDWPEKASNNRRVIACYNKSDWDAYYRPDNHIALATAAEIDAVRRPM